MEVTDKICALMRQTWYEAAKRNLNEGERLLLYELMFERQFYKKDVEREKIPSPAVLAMFDLLAPSLDADREKAQRIVERNRLNGAKGGRPKSEAHEVTNPGETQKNPEKPTAFFGAPIIHYKEQYNTTNNNIFFSQEEETHKKTLLCLYFFKVGATKPVEEAARFWNYYAARDWTAPGGVKIKDIFALAKTWKPEKITEGIARVRRIAADLFTYVDERGGYFPYFIIHDFCTLAVSREDKTLTLSTYGKICEDYVSRNSALIADYLQSSFGEDWQLTAKSLPVIE